MGLKVHCAQAVNTFWNRRVQYDFTLAAGLSFLQYVQKSDSNQGLQFPRYAGTRNA